jgi:hypothetical protein
MIGALVIVAVLVAVFAVEIACAASTWRPERIPIRSALALPERLRQPARWRPAIRPGRTNENSAGKQAICGL